MVLTIDEKRERRKITNKKYRETHQDQLSLAKQIYNQTTKGKKSNITCKWKHRGLICDDIDTLYSKYLLQETCENCNVTFGVKGDGTCSFKTMDHSHTTHRFRAFLCHYCNLIRGE